MSRSPVHEHQMRRGGYFVCLGALVVLALLLGLLLHNASAADGDRRAAGRWYVHTLNVLIVTGELKASLHQAIESERAYLLTADGKFHDRFEASRQASETFTAQIASLTRDNPQQRQSIAIFRPLLTGYFAELRQTMALVRNGNDLAAVRVVRSGALQERLDRLLLVVDGMEHQEQQLLTQRRDAIMVAAHRTEESDYLLFGVAMVFLLLAFVAVLAALRARERLIDLSEELHRTATTDALTGLANRRSFEEALAQEIDRAARHGGNVCVAIIDLDFFKRINDNHGHQSGDQVLRSVAGVLREGLRSYDLAGRMGGEEFAILMPNTALAEAKRICDRLRETIENHRIRLPNGAIASVTFSVGLACMQSSENGDQVFGRADRALYDAKADGRNAVRLAA